MLNNGISASYLSVIPQSDFRIVAEVISGLSYIPAEA